MNDPILFALDDDAATLVSLAGALERRFGSDYRVLSDRSPGSALARLQRACDQGESVVLLVADQWMPEMTGIDWLARARELCPRASRCFLVSHGDAAAFPLIHRATTLGLIERPPYPLEASLPGVFAAGDVRERSVKRMASAVGEGAIVINSVHEYLSEG